MKIKIHSKPANFNDQDNIDRRDLEKTFECLGVYSYLSDSQRNIIFLFCGSRFRDRYEENETVFADFATSEQCEIVDASVLSHWHFKLFYSFNEIGAQITALASPALCEPYALEAMTNSEAWATDGLLEEVQRLGLASEIAKQTHSPPTAPHSRA